MRDIDKFFEKLPKGINQLTLGKFPDHVCVDWPPNDYTIRTWLKGKNILVLEFASLPPSHHLPRITISHNKEWTLFRSRKFCALHARDATCLTAPCDAQHFC